MSHIPAGSWFEPSVIANAQGARTRQGSISEAGHCRFAVD
jgi:hypothetical protein